MIVESAYEGFGDTPVRRTSSEMLLAARKHFRTTENYEADFDPKTGAVVRTDDVGATWQAQTPRSQFKLNDVFFVDRLRGWAVGDNGTIRHTARGGGS